MIEIQQLQKRYPGTDAAAVADLSLDVDDGAFYTLLGPSGCGKTTTLRCVAGLERADAGTIRLDGAVVSAGKQFVPPAKREVGMVFQTYAVWPHMSVYENVAFPIRARGNQVSKAERDRRVREMLELVGLGEMANRMGTQLSGGQQQRLALARALVSDPKVLLLDEPLSNLDAELRVRMRAEIKSVHERLGITMMYVTHDQLEAFSMSDRIAVMFDGHLVQEGTPQDLYEEPATARVAGFLGSTNIFEGRLSEQRNGSAVVETKLGAVRCGAVSSEPMDGSAYVVVRPEDVMVRSHSDPLPDDVGTTIPGSIALRLYSGQATDCEVHVNGGTVITARLPSRLVPAESEVLVTLPLSRCRVLPR